MSLIWSFSKSISKQLTKSTNFLTISSKDVRPFNTIESIEKGRITKSKTVTFGEVEIVDVESYKKYNELNELSLEDKEIGCSKKCSIYCQCNIF